jgi:hypothetical protein
LLKWQLRSWFRAIIVGYNVNCSFVADPPPCPPIVHYSHVFRCDPDDLRAVMANPAFLRILLNAKDIPSDEVVAACVRTSADQAWRGTERTLHLTAGRELARLLSTDYVRLQEIMRRITG